MNSEIVQDARETHKNVDTIRQVMERRLEHITASSNLINLVAFILGLFLSVVVAGYLIDQFRNDPK